MRKSRNRVRLKQLLLAIDVGNSSTSFAVFNHAASFYATPILIGELATGTLTAKTLLKNLSAWLRAKKIANRDLKNVLVSSVVPSVDSLLEKTLFAFLRLKPIFISTNNITGIKVNYAAPKEVGADRIVNARAAVAYHRGPVVVVDFGTATTFDCISAKNEYLGGVIAPGPVIAAEALYQKTAKLPLVVLKAPAKVLGRNTLESIESGLYHGYRGLVKEILARLKFVLGGKTYVIATGGQAQWILKGVSEIDQFVSELTLRGLYLLWKDQALIPSRKL